MSALFSTLKSKKGVFLFGFFLTERRDQKLGLWVQLAPKTQNMVELCHFDFCFVFPFVLASFSSKYFPNGKKKGQPLTVPHLILLTIQKERVSPNLSLSHRIHGPSLQEGSDWPCCIICSPLNLSPWSGGGVFIKLCSLWRVTHQKPLGQREKVSSLAVYI